MKKLVNVQEVSGEGLEALLGEKVLLFCLNYIYTGTLVGVNDTCVLLDDASLVYETGPFTTPGYKDSQKLPGGKWYVSRSVLESFGLSK